MFANHIKGLKQNPGYNKSSQLYTWGRKCRGDLPGVRLEAGETGEKDVEAEVKEARTEGLLLIFFL